MDKNIIKACIISSIIIISLFLLSGCITGMAVREVNQQDSSNLSAGNNQTLTNSRAYTAEEIVVYESDNGNVDNSGDAKTITIVSTPLQQQQPATPATTRRRGGGGGGSSAITPTPVTPEPLTPTPGLTQKEIQLFNLLKSCGRTESAVEPPAVMQ